MFQIQWMASPLKSELSPGSSVDIILNEC